jgi:beta-lactamase class D
MKIARALNLLTRRAALGLPVGAMAVMACGRDPLAAGSTERADLEAIFAENGLAGRFVLYDVAADHLTLINANRTQTRFVPASTFKVANRMARFQPSH